MRERLTFHLDEHVHPAVGIALHEQGIDVTTAFEIGLVTDHHLFELARDQAWVIVTHDADLLRLADAGEPHAGIAYCARDAMTADPLARALIAMYQTLEPDEIAGEVEYL